MREILFRGRISKNEWVYGLPIEGEPLMGRGKETCIVTKPGLSYYDGVLMTYDECVEVDPDTVGQFTGLTDRNSTKIFEGDIVHVKAHSGSFTGCVTYWLEEEPRFVCETKHGLHYAICAKFEFEVLGNIHDNPELLEVSE